MLQVCAARQLGTSVWRQAVCLFLMLLEDGTVRYTGDLVRGTLFVEKVGPFMAAFRARYTMSFTPHISVSFRTSDSGEKMFFFFQTTQWARALLQKLIILCYSSSPHFIEYLQSLEQSQDSTAAFHLEVNEENSGLLRYYAASRGNFLPTFRGNLSVTSTTTRFVITQQSAILVYFAAEA